MTLTPRDDLPASTLPAAPAPSAEEDDFILIDPQARKGSFQAAPLGKILTGPSGPTAAPAVVAEPGEHISLHTVRRGHFRLNASLFIEQELAPTHLAFTCTAFCELFNALAHTADRQIARCMASQKFFLQATRNAG